MSHLVATEYKCFEDIRRTRPDGSEYWCARELAPVLDYAKWENFAKVIKRAMIACENSGHDTAADFPEVRKIVKAGATTKNIINYEFTPTALCCRGFRFVVLCPQVIVPVLPLRAQALYIVAHILQGVRHAVAGILARFVIIQTEVHRVQLRVLPQALQYGLDGGAAAGHIAVL